VELAGGLLAHGEGDGHGHDAVVAGGVCARVRATVAAMTSNKRK
jgi:hypothetical protein